LAAVAVHAGVLQHGFVNWDDGEYVYENAVLASPQRWSLHWLSTAVVGANWHPLTLVSYALDYSCWGLDPTGYHLTNLLLHVVSSVLVFHLFRRLIGEGAMPTAAAGAMPVAAMVAALLFAVHPVHVESVAWVSERKDVLCACFYLASCLAYLRYARQPRPAWPWYLLTLAFFALALLAKPMAVSLPVVLLILDFVPLRRFGRLAIVEKLPFVLLSLASCAVTLWAQEEGGALRDLVTHPLDNRLLVAVRAYGFYLVKLAVPVGLAPIYPYPQTLGVWDAEILGALLLLIAVTVAVVRAACRGQPVWLALWVYYLVTLLPVIGVVQVGQQAAADRYLYLPSLAPFLGFGLATAALERQWRGERIRHRLLLLLAAAIVAALGWTTVRQTHYWRDSLALWDRQIAIHPGVVAAAYYSRGNVYLQQGRHDEALADFSQALTIAPGHVLARNQRGNLHMRKGDIEQAVADFSQAVERRSDFSEGWYNRGNAYMAKGDFDRAVADYTKALECRPAFHEAWCNRGSCHYALASRQRQDWARCSAELRQASADFTEAIARCGTFTPAWYGRGLCLSMLGDLAGANRDFTRAVELAPESAAHWNERGLVRHRLGAYAEASADFSRAIQLSPATAEFYANRASAQLEGGKIEEAIADFSWVLRAAPSSQAYYGRGVAYLRQARPNQAIEDLSAAARLDPGNRAIAARLAEARQARDARDPRQASPLQP
jgi:tetratricopeptide (TPR) repeat protein